jgi:hypothetical protein
MMKLAQLVVATGLLFAASSCGSGDPDSIDDAKGGDASAVDSSTWDRARVDSTTTDTAADRTIVDSGGDDAAIDDAPSSDSAAVDTSMDGWVLDSTASDGAARDSTAADNRTADVSSSDARSGDTTAMDAVDASDVSTDRGAADAIDVDANRDVATYTVSVTLAGAGSGTVSSTPAGIDCGSTCTASYPAGTMLTLEATPAAGSTFSGWSGGGCSGNGSCQITVDDASAVTATFVVAQYALTVTPSGNGAGVVTSNPAAIDCGSTCAAIFDYGQSVTLSASASTHSTFMGWSGGGCSGTAPCTVAMTTARNVTATFTLEQHALTVIKAGNGAGTVTTDPVGINCGSTCSFGFPYGQDVTLTASPSAGSTFTGWSGSGCTGTAPCLVSVTAASSVTAAFTLEQRTLTVNKTGTGTGTVVTNPAGIDCGLTCSADYDYGTVVSVYATSDTSAFMGWTGSCNGTGACSITMNSSRLVTANFVPPLTCTNVATASACTNGALPVINLGQIAPQDCHDRCQISMKQAGMTTGCWIFAADGYCYCRSGSLSGGGTRPGGSCN